MVKIIEACNQSDSIYDDLNFVISNLENYKYINIERYLPEPGMKRYRFIKNLELIFPIGFYQYHAGNYLGTTTFIWKIPIEVNDLAKVTPVLLRNLYHDLTVDLRINNGFKGTSFDIFWEEVDSYFNENTPAVDDRRHGSTLYIPIVLSIRDLRESIISRLQTRLGNPLPSETNIPSDEWIRVQFTPKNTLAHSVINYTGRFNIRYKVQARLLRKDHPDSHYCAGYFRYLREFAIKKSLIPDNTILAASDHDFTKLSLIPSVILLCKIPASISELFYHGKVYTSYKNTVFKPSSGIRHSTEFFSILSDHYLNSTEIPPIMYDLYTDRGPDHRITYGSVQVSLLCLFIRGNFDMLIAMRTAPAQSWTNSAERIMSILKSCLADDEEIARFFEAIISIDSTLRYDETTQLILQQHSDLQNFIQTHC
ncbi:hypothetical protein GLOIN_2v1885121 [Rhizophagus irregularis DAOM 181602=DAOM 197198]|nr:hypothetical protein GLOIN_2v1885121 [Rhizophagus irregularis DAOM 181602=DAOM 197198]